MGLIVADVAPVVTEALSPGAMPIGVVVVASLFRPPTNRYVKARRM